MEKTIYTITDYPDNGDHQECDIGLPFEIRKGEDGYFWTDKKGKKCSYNIFKSDKIDNRWIVHLTEDANKSLINIFEIKMNKDLNKIIDYCVSLYKKSLSMEIKRLTQELKSFNNN
jgi:hypothetical protein